jgi:hypothetical protein
MWLTLEKARDTSAQKCIAKKSPVINCNPKHRPSKEPKFHKEEILTGEGRSIKAPLTIFNAG